MNKVSIESKFHCVMLVNGVRLECHPGDVISFEPKDADCPSVCIIELESFTLMNFDNA